MTGRLPLCLAAVCISLVLCGCDVDHYANLIEGKNDGTVTLALLESPSSEEPSSVGPVATPTCDDYLWRAQWYDCHGKYLRDMD